MAIERDAGIRFHEQGTLNAVTKWINSHDEGLAEWLKNVRRAYQRDRADVSDEHRAALLLMMDAKDDCPPRIGLLDVGGATLDDVERWSVWQDPHASSRGSTEDGEITQGNGGKAYMYACFSGPAQITGVRNRRLSRKGMEGNRGTLDRGIPGFIPDTAHGRNLEVTSWKAELCAHLLPYDCRFEELPPELRQAIESREAFTLVEGADPTYIFRGKLVAEDLTHKLLRHDQSTIAVQQLRLYAMYNGTLLNDGKPLELDPIPPHPGFEQPTVYEIPERLGDDTGRLQSTTLDGTRPAGRVILHTACDNMHRKHKELRSRWKVTYRAGQNMIGSKSVSELVPNTPGNQFVYATVELSALEPDYVALGRVRPNDGPLIRAVDIFVGDCIRELAKKIHEQRRHDLDQQQLDEVQRENQKLDDFKNRFLPEGMNTTGTGPNSGGDDGEMESEGPGGPPPPPPPPPPPRRGETPATIELGWDTQNILRVGRGIELHCRSVLRPHVRDKNGWIVPNVKLQWYSSDRHVIEFVDGDLAKGIGKGSAKIWVEAAGSSIRSAEICVDVWNVDHVLLTPRSLEIPLGKRKQIIAEVTNDEGVRATNVILMWKHDADDPLIVRINPFGSVTGNRLGRTRVTAGVGELTNSGLWARIPAEVNVVPSEGEVQKGSGFPQLLLTGKDVDPETGEVRQGDPEQPELWQEVSDFRNNVWWLNLDNPAAFFHFNQRHQKPELWRSYHAQKTVEMVEQVHMQVEFTQKGSEERPDNWVSHKAALERFEVHVAQMMWEYLKEYVSNGEGLD